LLRAFRLGPADLEANRAGVLSGRQRSQLRRGVVVNMGAAALLLLGLVALVYFLAARPVSPLRYALMAAMAVGIGGLGAGAVRGRLSAIRAGVVECLAGPVRLTLRGRAGSWVGIDNRSFPLPVGFWHLGGGRAYRVYVAPAAKVIVAMEPDGWD
jgi:hypothetical protein